MVEIKYSALSRDTKKFWTNQIKASAKHMHGITGYEQKNAGHDRLSEENEDSLSEPSRYWRMEKKCIEICSEA